MSSPRKEASDSRSRHRLRTEPYAVCLRIRDTRAQAGHTLCPAFFVQIDFDIRLFLTPTKCNKVVKSRKKFASQVSEQGAILRSTASTPQAISNCSGVDRGNLLVGRVVRLHWQSPPSENEMSWDLIFRGRGTRTTSCANGRQHRLQSGDADASSSPC